MPPPSDITWFTVAMGIIQFLTAIVIGLVCFIIKGILSSHKELAQEFKEFRLEYAAVNVPVKTIEQHHARIAQLEDTILVMGSELHAKGHISQPPRIAQGLAWK